MDAQDAISTLSRQRLAPTTCLPRETREEEKTGERERESGGEREREREREKTKILESMSNVLVRGMNKRVLGQRLCAATSRSQHHAARASVVASRTLRAAASRTCTTSSVKSVVEERTASPSLPWDHLSLNSNAVYVDEKREGGEQDVNVGKCIDVLREELPLALVKDFTYDGIYSEEVALIDEISPSFGRKAKTTVGKESLKRVMFGLRFHTWLFFSNAKFEVKKMWQPEKDRLCVRWSFAGLPRLATSTYYVDGMAEFKMNSKGNSLFNLCLCLSLFFLFLFSLSCSNSLSFFFFC